jgi:hypothetical protein
VLCSLNSDALSLLCVCFNILSLEVVVEVHYVLLCLAWQKVKSVINLQYNYSIINEYFFLLFSVADLNLILSL